MAIHKNAVSMLRESLEEYLVLAKLGINHKKPNNGVLGYPSATLLFAVVDTIGSYHRGDPNFKITVDGKLQTIEKTSDHALILNSNYFRCDLSGDALREIYSLMRSALTHNAVLGRGLSLHVGEPRPVIRMAQEGVELYLPGFLELCRTAVERFLEVADKVVPTSQAVKELEGKARGADVRRSSQPLLPPFQAYPSAQASAMPRPTQQQKFRKP